MPKLVLTHEDDRYFYSEVEYVDGTLKIYNNEVGSQATIYTDKEVAIELRDFLISLNLTKEPVWNFWMYLNLITGLFNTFGFSFRLMNHFEGGDFFPLWFILTGLCFGLLSLIIVILFYQQRK